MAWNPPTLFVFLLPLAWLSFKSAKFAWLMINLIIVITATLMLVDIYLPVKNTKFILASLLFALIFPPVFTGLYMGQVTFLVFLGLVASMALIKKEQWFWAGAALVLTTIKPHLAILSVIYLLIYMAQQRKFKGWIGLFFSAIFCMVLLFLFTPNWLNDLIGLTTIAPVNWATPTIGGILRYKGITDSARYLIILFLPLPFILAKYHRKFSMGFSVALLTLITVPVTFFGWSYDQTMLLIPIVLVFSWLAQFKKWFAVTMMAIAIVLSIGVNLYERILSTNDVYYFWVPLFWWLIFASAWYHFSSQNNRNDQSTL